MPILKKTFLSIVSIFLLWQSFVLLPMLIELRVRSWGLSILVAWIINMCFTGAFAFAGFALPTHKLMPKMYYVIRNPKRLNRFYRFLRVDLFRKALLATLWKKEDQRKKFFNGKRNNLSHLIDQSEKAEFGHLIPFVLLIIVGIFLIMNNLNRLGVFVLLINFVGNFYPVLLQRYHRMRIQNMKPKVS